MIIMVITTMNKCKRKYPWVLKRIRSINYGQDVVEEFQKSGKRLQLNKIAIKRLTEFN